MRRRLLALAALASLLGGFLVGDTASAIAASQGGNASMRIGTVTAYDAAAGTLTVTVGGTAMPGVFYNPAYLPLIGDTVAVMNAGPTWYVLGSTTNTTSRILPVAATVTTFETQPDSAWADLSTPGPAVTVMVGATGKVLATMSVQIQPGPLSYGYVGIAVSGANTLAPDAKPVLIAFTESTTSYNYENPSRTVLFEGLNPGLTTFTLKYQSSVFDPSFQTAYLDRTLTVQPY